ncbi:MAG: UDP-N-acetylglucosamine [Geobacteraceae bacterium]|nr:MAG: UDP-N-acetylglucosamine [Geobacteraceae bacterium]
MKIAPICEELQKRGIPHILVHTGQHYDQKMSKLFFEELAIPKPDMDLGVGSGTQAQQTAEIMMRLEPVLEKEKPALLIVVGDVNSTMAAAITAAKLNIPVAHVESGLRSFDRTMPEEINRLLTDAVADYHFTTEASANDNLVREGVARDRIFFVGNTMIDTLLKHVERAARSSILGTLGIEAGKYGVITLHRPSNVDDRKNLQEILEALNEIASELPLVFPVHPRTRRRIAEFGFDHLVKESSARVSRQEDGQRGIFVTEPLGYLDFLKLTKDARIVFTDSGGIQEETTVMGIPCITLRYNTERPVTVTSGTNVLVGAGREKIIAEGRKRLDGFARKYSIPPLWDGHAAERIVDIICSRVAG